MKRHRLQLAITGLLAALAFGTAQANVSASGYTFTTVDVPGNPNVPQSGSYLTGINLFGQASGINSPSTGGIFGMVYSQGGYALFSDPMSNGFGTFAMGISDDGFVVGRYNVDGGQTHGYILTDGTFLTIDPPNGWNVTSYGVNNMGDAVGVYYPPSADAQSGFLYRHGAFEKIDDPNGRNTIAFGINDVDQVVGCSYYTEDIPNGSVTRPKGFFDDHGNFTDIVFPDAYGTFATGINDLGEIVGNYYNSDFNGNDQGFVYQNGNYTTLNVPDAILTRPTGVNQLGVVVGIYVDTNFVYHTFIATPA